MRFSFILIPPSLYSQDHANWSKPLETNTLRETTSFTFDLNTAIPFWSLAPEERKAYWDDHIHLTPAGYDLMGEKIAARLVEIIMPPGRLQPQQAASTNGGTPRRKKLFKDDDKVFEEEDGDEHRLEHGYYVVRRKDLE